MNSRVSWSVDGIDPSVRERAEAAARRAGMSLNDWLNSTMGETSSQAYRAPAYDQAPPMPSQESRDVADIHQRLDAITRQIEQISQPKPRSEPAPGSEAFPRNDVAPRVEAPQGAPAVARQLNDAISRLDARLSQISNPQAPRETSTQERQRREDAVERAAAQLYRPSPSLSPTSFDSAIAEITARQNELDAPPPRPIPTRSAPPLAPIAPPMTPAAAPIASYTPPPVAPPASAGPDFSALERHLLKI